MGHLVDTCLAGHGGIGELADDPVVTGQTSWLVRSGEDRRLLRDTEEAITRARKVSIAVISASLVFFIGGHGWWFVPIVIAYALFATFCERRRQRDEYATEWMFALTILTQVTFAACATLSGGPESPALLWLVVAMVPMSARYGQRGAIAGSAVTFVCLVGASLSHGWAAFVDSPDMFFATLSAGVSC
ncbi:MAG: hypothetical protein Q7T73_07205, partial [Beijerinckiaceae bacterium]|nr:hypothetical protein [Beijerinckiaceae bacterium]